MYNALPNNALTHSLHFRKTRSNPRNFECFDNVLITCHRVFHVDGPLHAIQWAVKSENEQWNQKKMSDKWVIWIHRNRTPRPGKQRNCEIGPRSFHSCVKSDPGDFTQQRNVWNRTPGVRFHTFHTFHCRFHRFHCCVKSPESAFTQISDFTADFTVSEAAAKSVR